MQIMMKTGVLLLVSVALIAPQSDRPTTISLAEKILLKIASGLKKSVARAGETCGVPKIPEQLKNVTIQQGQTARFHCFVDMQCLVSYIHWSHSANGSEELVKTNSHPGDPYSLIVEDVSTDDSGFYTCTAGNILGETESTAYLEVSRAPQTDLLSQMLLPIPLLLLLISRHAPTTSIV